MAKKKWIQKAIKKPGSLKRIAKKAGKLTKKGTIKTGYLEELAERSGKIGQKARLAKTLKKLRK
jgi:hypothetical protein